MGHQPQFFQGFGKLISRIHHGLTFNICQRHFRNIPFMLCGDRRTDVLTNLGTEFVTRQLGIIIKLETKPAPLKAANRARV